jgi:hypothetical protein
MFGGMGGGRSTLRMVRLSAFVLILVVGATLHRQGSTYNALHVVYFVIIAAVVIASIASRGRGRGPGYGRGRRGPGGSRFGGGSFGSGPPATDMPAENPDPEAGPRGNGYSAR